MVPMETSFDNKYHPGMCSDQGSGRSSGTNSDKIRTGALQGRWDTHSKRHQSQGNNLKMLEVVQSS
jgi:hypothetical protein